MPAHVSPSGYASEQTTRQWLDERLGELREDWYSWDAVVHDICNQMAPYRRRDSKGELNSGLKKEQRIINDTPVRALQWLSAGLMSAYTSPARRWFDLTTEDLDIADSPRVKRYLDVVQERIESHLKKSGYYGVLSNDTYYDIGSHGTGAIWREGDQEGNLNYTGLLWGEYYLSSNHLGVVDTCFRVVPMKVRQIVRKFGIESVSARVRAAWEGGDLNDEYDIGHAVFPNDEFEHGKIGPKGRRFRSLWWELDEAIKGDDEDLLRDSGYSIFPLLIAQWITRPGDSYARGPGWSIRGDCRQLQHLEKRKIELVDKHGNPPMKARGLRSHASQLPGDVTFMGEGADALYEPSIRVDPNAIQVLYQYGIVPVEQRIKSALHTELWRFILDDNRNQRATATEIEAVRQEIMLQLGPLLENLDDGLLKPTIEGAYLHLDAAGKLPIPPPELEGVDIKVQFRSILHQAQQSVNLSGVRSVLAEVASLSQYYPQALDAVDPDVAIEEIAKAAGVRSDLIRSEETRDRIRKERARAQQQQQMAEEAEKMTQSARNLGGAGFKPQEITDIARSISPAAAAQGGVLSS